MNFGLRFVILCFAGVSVLVPKYVHATCPTGTIAAELARIETSYIKVIETRPLPEGGMLIRIRNNFKGMTPFEFGNIEEAIRTDPDFSEKWGMSVTPEGDLWYPDPVAFNRLI